MLEEYSSRKAVVAVAAKFATVVALVVIVASLMKRSTSAGVPIAAFDGYQI